MSIFQKITSYVLQKNFNPILVYSDIDRINLWTPLIQSQRGAKRGYRGRTNANRKKKAPKAENTDKVIKEKTFNVKKKNVIIDDNLPINSLDYEEYCKRKPTDNIYLLEKFLPKLYDLKEAIIAHKDVASPAIYDNLDGLFYIKMLLNMNTSKKNKPLTPFSGILLYKNPFDFPMKFNNRILAFAHKLSEQEMASEAGALITGGKELVKKIIKGTIKRTDFDHVICTPEILPEIISLRGILRNSFPNTSKGSVDTDLCGMVKKFSKSVTYKTEIVENNLSTVGSNDSEIVHKALLECMLAKIGMPLEQIVQNFETLVDTLMSHKPNTIDPVDFIIKIYLSTPPNPEVFEISFKNFLENPVDQRASV
ncbi:unnamed protein product [Gordionus sp. m RMFG-2023]|uniref:large ribosomal subunit protein uL1m-like isoform X2 n=1 Tax=Gordionus sp. m RMFG-2023 TaxID=3053472 RepID=UPI0030E376A2